MRRETEDFGLYRIMHAKSAEVTQFLDTDLLPQVKAAFGLYKTADKAELEKELAKAIEQAQGLGVDPETTQKVKDLRARLKSDAVDIGALESEGSDHLFSFFRRHYSEGDFLAKRVYLAQLEDFQKKLWLKKKFVVETSWCIRVGCISESFYPEIAANDAQREEWVQLFAINEIKADLTTPGYSVPLKPAFLKAHSTLVVDTRHFDADFTARLLDAIGDVDEQTDGVLFHSENFQALALIDDRLALSRRLMTDDGSHIVAIDKNEQEALGHAGGGRCAMTRGFACARNTVPMRLAPDNSIS